MFSYHDNKVTVHSNDDETTMGGHFTVTDYSITPGQDPKNHNSKGMVVPLDGGDFKFVVGRKASGTVADFFNRTIKTSENTFNHEAGELNFAFFGTLELTIGGGKIGPKTTLTFNNVCLAQGQSGSTNNWWFGIVGGQWKDDPLKSVRVKDAEGKWLVDFYRGQGSTVVSTVAYRIVQKL